jgi:ribonuclease HI
LVHKEPKVNIFTSIQGLENRILEHYAENVKVPEIVLHNARWCPPHECHIKLDTDAAVSLNSSTIAVVARDSGGTFCLAWTKHTKVSDPLCVEATAILWAIQLAKLENLTHIVVESDSKICIDSIKGHPEEVNWNVAAFISDVIALASDFITCCISWVKRDTNGTTHELARFAFLLNSDFSCNEVLPFLPLSNRLGKEMRYVFVSLS